MGSGRRSRRTVQGQLPTYWTYAAAAATYWTDAAAAATAALAFAASRRRTVNEPAAATHWPFATAVITAALATCTLLLNGSIHISAQEHLGEIELALPGAPALQRNLGFMGAETLSQLEGLIDVDSELRAIPTSCAVCRIAALEGFSTAILTGLESGDADALWERALQRTLCQRCESRGLFGVLARRRLPLRRVCDGLMNSTSGLAANLTRTAVELRSAAANGILAPLRRHFDSACVAFCLSGPVDKWPAIVEIVLGHVR